MDRREMDKNSDREKMRNFAGNIGYRNRMKRSNKSISYLVVGFIVMICLIAVLLLFFRSCGEEGTEEIKLILKRLNKLEEELPHYAEIGNKIDRLENQVKGLQNSVSKLERDSTTLRSELKTISTQIRTLKEEFSSITSKTKASGTVQKKTTSQVKGNYHEVQLGDTLYGIANKYGLSVEELCSMNNISKGRTIHPGQQILVK
ncbi:LysM peptidoglycan-binding domain-containing protein [Thermodesulfobacteriota bacterium]